MNAFICIDTHRWLANSHATWIVGWFAAEYHIADMVLESAEGGYYRLEYGYDRPDVLENLPGLATGVKCGFTVQFEGRLSSADHFLWVLQEGRGWRRFSVNWNITSPQVIDQELDNESTWTWQGLKERAARLKLVLKLRKVQSSFGLEQRVRSWIDHTPFLHLRIDLINKCNLRCVMCHYNNPAYHKRPRKVVSVEEFSRLFDPIGRYVKTAMLSCADEPLLAPSFEDVLRHISERFPNVEMSFCTNGTLFDINHQKTVIESGVSRVMVSIDGVRPETFETIRRGAKFERVLTNMINFSKLKRFLGVDWPKLQINMVLMKSNIHEAPAVVRMAKGLGAVCVEFHHAVPTWDVHVGRDQLRHHRALFNAYRQEVVELGEKLDIEIVIPDAFPGDDASDIQIKKVTQEHVERLWQSHSFEPIKLTELRKPPSGGEVNPRMFAPDLYCTLPFHELYVLDQNNVMPCPYQKQVSASLDDYSDLREAYFSSQFVELREAMTTREGHPGCKDCPRKSGLLLPAEMV